VGSCAHVLKIIATNQAAERRMRSSWALSWLVRIHGEGNWFKGAGQGRVKGAAIASFARAQTLFIGRWPATALLVNYVHLSLSVGVANMVKKARPNESDESLIPGGFAESSPGRTLARVHAALRGEFDAHQLEPDEARIFDELWTTYMAGPNPERDAFVAKMREEGGYVGEDDQGRLVRTLPGGGIELIRDSTMSDYSSKDIGPLQGLEPVREREPTIIGGEGYTDDQVNQLVAMLSADKKLWYVTANRDGKELTVFRGPHP